MRPTALPRANRSPAEANATVRLPRRGVAPRWRRTQTLHVAQMPRPNRSSTCRSSCVASTASANPRDGEAHHPLFAWTRGRLERPERKSSAAPPHVLASPPQRRSGYARADRFPRETPMQPSHRRDAAVTGRHHTFGGRNQHQSSLTALLVAQLPGCRRRRTPKALSSTRLSPMSPAA
jgi:hypothetical protein